MPKLRLLLFKKKTPASSIYYLISWRRTQELLNSISQNLLQITQPAQLLAVCPKFLVPAEAQEEFPKRLPPLVVAELLPV